MRHNVLTCISQPIVQTWTTLTTLHSVQALHRHQYKIFTWGKWMQHWMKISRVKLHKLSKTMSQSMCAVVKVKKRPQQNMWLFFFLVAFFVLARECVSYHTLHNILNLCLHLRLKLHNYIAGFNRPQRMNHVGLCTSQCSDATWLLAL